MNTFQVRILNLISPIWNIKNIWILVYIREGLQYIVAFTCDHTIREEDELQVWGKRGCQESDGGDQPTGDDGPPATHPQDHDRAQRATEEGERAVKWSSPRSVVLWMAERVEENDVVERNCVEQPCSKQKTAQSFSRFIAHSNTYWHCGRFREKIHMSRQIFPITTVIPLPSYFTWILLNLTNITQSQKWSPTISTSTTTIYTCTYCDETCH